MRTEATFLGVVRRVIGSKVFVEVSPDIPSASPIINGRIYRLGQIGTFVRIPLGFTNLYGIISMVGASDSMNHQDSIEQSMRGQRWVEVQLVGESYGNNDFQRGVSIFPTIDDEAHIVTEEDLSLIYSTNDPDMINIGWHAASENLQASINLDKLITRHSAIVGSTGSGKSNTVAGLLKALSTGVYPSAQIVVIDLHGEYAEALAGVSKSFRINDEKSPLIVPYWALSFDELAAFLYDRRSTTESMQDAAIRDAIFERKKKSCSVLKSGVIASTDITVDSPVPFDINEMFSTLYVREHATLLEKDNWDTIAYKKDENGNELKGNVEELKLPEFKPPGAGSSSPFTSTRKLQISSQLTKIYGRLKDRRFKFLLSPGEYDGTIKDLDELVQDWIGHSHPITVFDLSGLPFEVVDLVVGVITRVIFESMFWGRDMPGIGRQRPLLVVYEEAHAYLPRGGNSPFVSGYASNSVRRIFKEGRKYGVGGMVVSQRPSDLDETLLSQCGTFFALRLSNSDDQARIRSTVPDSLSGLMELLPALRIGECILLGEALQIPSRVRLPIVEPRPKSDDPKVSISWREGIQSTSSYKDVVNKWRVQGQ